MKTFRFVAGEQVITRRSYNMLDAYLGLSIWAVSHPIPSEFKTLPIEVYDVDGNLLGKRSWQGWHEAVLADTYGPDWKEKIQHAGELVR